MFRTFTRRHFKLSEDETPAASYIELRLEQLEDNELEAETLSDVISKLEAGNEHWGDVKMGADGASGCSEAS